MSPLRFRTSMSLDGFPLGEAIETFWLEPAHQAVPTWSEHRDINEVMLATRLAPAGFLALRPVARGA